MSQFEDFKKKHLQYLAKAALLNNQIGRDKKLLEEVRRFIPELQAFLNENKRKLDQKKAAELIAWRNRWIELTAEYR